MNGRLATPLQIYASGEYYATACEPAVDLKQLTLEATGKSIRRISRFIQLALIGAGRCAQGQTLPAATGVYFASGRGDLDVTLDIMQQLFVAAQSPKPLAFVNTVSNASCYYVAQTLGLHCRSNYVCNQYFAFESALQLAALDVSLGTIHSALIGSVDVATNPHIEHRQRLRLSADAPVGEGSHWLWAGPRDTTRPSLGNVLAVTGFQRRDELVTWMQQHIAIPTHCALAAGQFLTEDEFSAIQHATDYQHPEDTFPPLAYYDSQSGGRVAAFLRSPSTPQLLHINRDPDGRYMVMWVSRD